MPFHSPRLIRFMGIALLSLPTVGMAQTSYTITTIAGNNTAGYTGDGQAPTAAQLNSPIQVALDASHNLYISDSANAAIRKILNGKIATFAGNGTVGYSGDGGAANKAQINTPYGITFDAVGNLYIADLENEVVREVTASNGNIATIAGINDNYNGFSGDGGPATAAHMVLPVSVAVDSKGDIYIADVGNGRIRIVTPDGNINTFAGNGTSGFSGDGGPASKAALNQPYGMAVDSAGNVYIADSQNHRIRKVAPNGTISTVVGTGKAGFSGDGGQALSAQLNRPWDVKVDAYGNLFIADYNNARIREVGVNGIITTIAGVGIPGYTGDGFGATNARLNSPSGVAVDSNGNVYIADSANNVIRQLTPVGPVVAAGGVITAGQFGAFPSIAPGTWIEIYGTGLGADTRSWGTADFNGVNAPTSLDGTSVTIGGQSAYVDYISGGQINAQVPSATGTGQQQLIIKTAAGASAAVTVPVNATQPGLYAPSYLKINGQQYVSAQFSDGTYAAPVGAVSGFTSRRANPGDVVTVYGVGFGPVTPNIPAGQVVQQNNTLTLPLQVQIGGTPATVSYQGLAPSAVGLYQFNIVTPNVAANDAAPITFSLGGTPVSQTLYIAVN